MPRKSETKRALSGMEDGCGGGRGWEEKRQGKEGRGAVGDGAGEGRWRGARREAHGTGLGREDGGERDGRRMGGETGGDGAVEGDAC